MTLSQHYQGYRRWAFSHTTWIWVAYIGEVTKRRRFPPLSFVSLHIYYYVSMFPCMAWGVLSDEPGTLEPALVLDAGPCR
jgi:hypothetical protein